MLITQVEVMVHEKRNHPHEYGHYDAEVRVVAVLKAGESVDKRIEELQIGARKHVAAECDAWISEIERKQELQNARYNIVNRLRDHAWGSNAAEDSAEAIQAMIAALPEDEHQMWQSKLAGAQEAREKRSAEDPAPF